MSDHCMTCGHDIGKRVKYSRKLKRAKIRREATEACKSIVNRVALELSENPESANDMALLMGRTLPAIDAWLAEQESK